MQDYIKELEWRGMIHNTTEGVEEQLKTPTVGYLGIDPTADSLHIGHLCGIMMLKHFQNCGHKPIILIGGATGMIGDPSGKSKERNLLDEETIQHNVESLKSQLGRFLDFDPEKPNAAEIVNNLDWMRDMSFLQFSREIGKVITVNYMMAKDSVKKRLDGEEGMSFTEFTYQLLQGYDFLYLHEHRNCRLQIGGSDQWGNITTGIDLIRKTTGDTKSFAITCPLLTKADGTKFGKTEKGNIWLSEKLTSPYEFYNFWMNTSDEDAQKYIKIFTTFSEEEIGISIQEAKEHPEARVCQTELAQYLTYLVHGKENLEKILKAIDLLYTRGSLEDFLDKPEREQVEMMEFLRTVIPSYEVSINSAETLVDVLSDVTGIFSSRSKAREAITSGSISIFGKPNNDPWTAFRSQTSISGKYWLVRFGKKKYHLIIQKTQQPQKISIHVITYT